MAELSPAFASSLERREGAQTRWAARVEERWLFVSCGAVQRVWVWAWLVIRGGLVVF